MVSPGGAPLDVKALRARLAAAGQEHVLAFWDTLSAQERQRLAADAAAIDLDLIGRLAHGDGVWDAAELPYDRLDAPEVWSLGQDVYHDVTRRDAVARGEALLAEGKVAVVVVAGGQGTRLGFPGPKGTFPIGPVSGKTLFAIHCAKIRALRARYGAALPFLVMTSHVNDEQTRRYFALHGRFGLEDIHFFTQGTMPAVDLRGRLFLASRDRVFRSPDGHGGTVKALASSGMAAMLHARGVTELFYFQVDNPLVKVCEPFFLGAHVLAGSEYSLKVLRKSSPDEKLGVLARAGGAHLLVEYSDLPAALRDARDTNGAYRYWAGSPAIHIFHLAFLARMAASEGALPYHRAVKKIPHIDTATGAEVKPAKPNGIKFETFIFDIMPRAERILACEGIRDEEFTPVKNQTGEDSIESCRRMMSALHWQWLENRGVAAPRDGDGAFTRDCEIHPTFALTADDVPADVAARLQKNGPVYLE